VVKIPFEVFWVVMLCSIVVEYPCFRGPCPEDGGTMDFWNVDVITTLHGVTTETSTWI